MSAGSGPGGEDRPENKIGAGDWLCAVAAAFMAASFAARWHAPVLGTLGLFLVLVGVLFAGLVILKGDD